MDTQSISTPTTLRFPPVPLASGDAVITEAAPIEVEGVTITAHLADGSDRTVVLEYRYGGWWVPANSLGV